MILLVVTREARGSSGWQPIGLATKQRPEYQYFVMLKSTDVISIILKRLSVMYSIIALTPPPLHPRIHAFLLLN